MPQEDLQAFEKMLDAYKELKASDPPYRVHYVNMNMIQKEFDQRLKSQGPAMDVKEFDKREAMQEQLEKEQVAMHASRLRKKGLGSPEASPKKPRRPRADTKDMAAMQAALTQMQKDAAQKDMADPDRAKTGTTEEIPSMPISKSGIPEYDAGRQGSMQDRNPNVTESRLRRPQPRYPVDATPMMTKRRPRATEAAGPPGGGREMSPSPPSVGLESPETDGPNRGKTEAQMMGDRRSVRQQLLWLMQYRRMATGTNNMRDYKFLAQRFEELGGNINALMQQSGGGAAAQGTPQTRPALRPRRNPPPQPTRAQVPQVQQSPNQMLNALRQFAQTGQRAGVAQAPSYPPQPRVVTQTQTVPIPIPMPMGGGRQQQPGRSGVVVKQTVKQQQKTTAQQKNKIRKRQQGSITNLRKQYTATKKQVKSAMMKAKKALYSTENSKIKKLPAKERKAARAKLRAAMKAKFDRLMSVAKPTTSFKTLEALTRAIAQLKKVKW